MTTLEQAQINALINRLRDHPELTPISNWAIEKLLEKRSMTLDEFTKAFGLAEVIFASERTRRQIDYNLRLKFGKSVAHIGYSELGQEYRDFSLSDMFGDDDARFLEWLGLEESPS